jgi:hypothetical protein
MITITTIIENLNFVSALYLRFCLLHFAAFSFISSLLLLEGRAEIFKHSEL